MAKKSTFEVALMLSATDRATRVVTEATKKISEQIARVSDVSDKAFDIGRRSAVVGAGFTALLAGPLKAAAEMETLNVSLRTSFQGNEAAAKQAFEKINRFAAATPYGLDEVTTGFIKLKNMGLDPSEEALTAYGNTASAMGKSLNDMVEAVADAATGEFERLKEFGIKASSEGDKVSFMFQGVKTTVGKNSKEIEQYLKYIGNVKFAGGIEAQSKTANGMLSTLKDGVVMTAAKIGTALLPQAKELITRVGAIVDRVAKWVENNPRLTSTILKVTAGAAGLSFTISALAFTFGGLMKIYQAALAIKRAYIFVTTLSTAAENGSRIAKIALSVANGVSTASQWLLNAAMYAFPLVWIIAAVVAVIAIVYLLVKNWDKVSAFFVGLWNKIKVLFAKAWDFIKQYGWLMVGPVGWIIKFWSMIPTWFAQLWPKVKVIFGVFIDWLKKLPEQFFTMGLNIIEGIWNGIKNKAEALVNFVKGIGKKIANGFKSVLGINSPSKVFAEYGLNITQGAKQGMEKGSPALNKTATGMGSGIAPKSVGGSRGSGGGSVNVTFAPVINAGGGNGQDIRAALKAYMPEMLREIEAAMARRNRLAY